MATRSGRESCPTLEIMAILPMTLSPTTIGAPVYPTECPRSSSGQIPHLDLRLLQPVRHPHLAVHRRRRGEMLLRLLALAGAPVELAKAEVAVGDEGAHAELAGECQRRAVVAKSVLDAAGRRDVTGEAEGVGLACPSP